MGTEILHPQDFLTERLRLGPVVLPRRKSYAGNPKSTRKPVIRPERGEPKKRLYQSEPVIRKKSNSADLISGRDFAGQVRILKRGESLDSKKNDVDLIVCSTERLGPDPEMVPKQIRITDLKSFLSPVAVRSDKYAGSAFSLSPSPRSLPLPSFSKKKEGFAIIDDSATKDLRRLLRLD